MGQEMPSATVATELGDKLAKRLGGQARFDQLTRTLYATDASIYQMTPLGVVLPRNTDDVVATLEECRRAGVSIIPRGAGTGLAGGAVGFGLQLDLSRHMTRIGPLNLDNRTIQVEPGVVLDHLNQHLAPHGLFFAPDVATSSRATIGGMIANNSCGARSVRYGRTVDHLAGLTVVLADGSLIEFAGPGDPAPSGNDLGVRIESELTRLRDENFEEIQHRFPKVLRSNGGYGLDRLGPPGSPARASAILCGSEGTLGIVVGAELKLAPLPRAKALAVLHFRELLAALEVTPAILAHQPSAVELVDRLIIDGGRRNAAIARRCEFLQGEPEALLVVEFAGEDRAEVRSRVDRLAADPSLSQAAYACAPVLEPAKQLDVWNLRKSGLGLLMSRPGDLQPQAFVEDTAVEPARLRDYVVRFQEILRGEGVAAASFYAHASVGCLHIRPVINLKDPADVARMRRIADAVSTLAIEFGGAMSGEHGDGILRSSWLEKTYGPRIVQVFREVKQLFDPDFVLNPGKIVDPYPMTDHLRFGPEYSPLRPKTYLDFSAHGGMAGLAEMCSGVGQCRQRLAGTMCPSYMATREEKDTTRGRANALRAALSGRLAGGLSNPELAEALELCLSCKACKTECPTGVDMARLKAEFLAQRHLREGVDPLSRLVADLPQRLTLASRFPRLANLVTRSATVRAVLENRYGLDRRVPLPRLASHTFRAWFRRRRRRTAPSATRGPIVYFVDTWTNHFSPETGIAAVAVLEHLGYEVICPQTVCCGRPAMSKGLLAEAAWLAETNVNLLARYARDGVPIVGTEPSCILSFVDEYPQLVRNRAAVRLSGHVQTIETFIARRLAAEPGILEHRENVRPLLYHAHCHQKALIGSDDAMALVKRIWGAGGKLIDAGCCGMAGSFGHEKAHYDVSKAIGEERLFPTVRHRGQAEVAIAGFSCREQIGHHTDVRPRHLIEHLAEALGLGARSEEQFENH